MMDKVLTMAKTKSKSVIIDGDVHGRFKLFCKGKSLKIGGVIEDLINLYLDKPKEIQKLVDEYKENF
jgi:hypothetical protein